MKAIAVIKEIPNDCDECPFVDGNCYCILLNEEAFPNEWAENAPYYSLKEKGDCPLRPLPQKKNTDKLQGFGNSQIVWTDKTIYQNEGWNACLDEIMGEEE